MMMNLLESLRTLRPLLKSLEGVGKDAAKFMAGLLHKSPTPTPHAPATPVPSIAPIAPIKTRPYSKPGSRPSFRKGVVEEAWENAKGPDGLVRDPTGEVIDWTPGTPRNGVWDMGHIPDEKYHDQWLRYMDGELTPKEFRDWYNNPENYRPELPSTNRSHRSE